MRVSSVSPAAPSRITRRIFGIGGGPFDGDPLEAGNVKL
jgi:hypothetical protein